MAEAQARVERVTATPAALELIATVAAQHGPLMFHQSGGCCDGSAPMCFALGEFIVGDHDRLLGQIGGMPFYISGPQFEYWQHTQLIIDVVPGRGGMFSLEGPTGQRFLTRSRLFTDAEWAALTDVPAPDRPQSSTNVTRCGQFKISSNFALSRENLQFAADLSANRCKRRDEFRIFLIFNRF